MDIPAHDDLHTSFIDCLTLGVIDHVILQQALPHPVMVKFNLFLGPPDIWYKLPVPDGFPFLPGHTLQDLCSPPVPIIS